MPNRLFEDKYDFLDNLLLAYARANKMAPSGFKIFLVVDDDFFQQIGMAVTHTDTTVLGLSESVAKLKLEPGSDRLMVFLCVQHAQDALPLVEFLYANKIKYLTFGGANVGGYVYDDSVSRKTIEQAYISQRIDGYAKFEDPGSAQDFVNLTQALAATNHLDGDVVEAGCYRGSSGSVMLEYSQNKNLRPKDFYFFDVFEGFTYEEALISPDFQWANTHVTEGEEVVRNRLMAKSGRNTVHVKKLNIISDPLPPEIRRISFANIDVDLHEAVYSALVRLAPLMAVGGIMICEDAGHTPALIGARYALEKFMQSENGKAFTPVHMTSGQVFLVKHTGQVQS
jgi:hypothetical protein